MTKPISIDWSSLHIHHGSNLPHWTVEAAIYHVIFRLADSIPKVKLDEWQQERQAILDRIAQQGRAPSDDELRRLGYLFSEHVERWLDLGYGNCWLNRPTIADLVAKALIHFNAQRYQLHAWCIMPSHVHIIVEPLPNWELSSILHSWTSYTASQANKHLGRNGQFWQHEPYDHIIRSQREYRQQLDYVYANPDKANLIPWP